MTLWRNPNMTAVIMSLWLIGLYIFWLVIRPSLIIPASAINHHKKRILNISQWCIIISILLLPLQLTVSTIQEQAQALPIIFVIDQSRSMLADDLTPSRRWLVQQLMKQLQSLPNPQQLISYAQLPQLHSWVTSMLNIAPITSSQWSSALGDARLIAYDQIWTWLAEPIIITITDGGSNTGYDLSQTSQILKTRWQLRIVGISTGTRIVAYDDRWRWLTSTMDATLLSSLADSWHRYPISDDSYVDWITSQLIQDLSSQTYQLWPINYDLSVILWILLWLWTIWYWWIYLSKAKKSSLLTS